MEQQTVPAPTTSAAGVARVVIGIVLLVLAANGLLQTVLHLGSVELRDDPMRLLGRLVGVGVFAAVGLTLLLSGLARRWQAADEARLRSFCATETMSARRSSGVVRPHPRRAQIFATATLFVDVERTAEGHIVFHGQDLAPPFGDEDQTEYEYSLTVPTGQTESLRRALRGGPDDDLVDLLVRDGAAIVHQGEQRWLRSLGIEPAFWNHLG